MPDTTIQDIKATQESVRRSFVKMLAQIDEIFIVRIKKLQEAEAFAPDAFESSAHHGAAERIKIAAHIILSMSPDQDSAMFITDRVIDIILQAPSDIFPRLDNN